MLSCQRSVVLLSQMLGPCPHLPFIFARAQQAQAPPTGIACAIYIRAGIVQLYVSNYRHDLEQGSPAVGSRVGNINVASRWHIDTGMAPVWFLGGRRNSDSIYLILLLLGNGSRCLRRVVSVGRGPHGSGWNMAGKIGPG